MGTQETIIYRLVMRNHDFGAFKKKAKWAWPPRWRQRIKTQPKSWPTFWVDHNLEKITFRKFGASTPNK